MRRFFATLLAALMLVSMIPVSAMAAEAITVIDAEDGAELYALVSGKSGAVQVNVSGRLTVETTGQQNNDKLYNNCTAITALTIVGTTEAATFVQTGEGISSLGLANGTLTFKDIIVDDESVSYSPNSWELCYANYTGKVVFDNCTIGSENGGIMTNGEAEFINCYIFSGKDNEYAVWINNGSATFTNCSFDGPRAIKANEAYGSAIEIVTIDTCSFTDLTEKPAVALGTLDADTSVEISDCTVTDAKPGDQYMYLVESDTALNTFSFTDADNTIAFTAGTVVELSASTSFTVPANVDSISIPSDRLADVEISSANLVLPEGSVVVVDDVEILSPDSVAADGEVSGGHSHNFEWVITSTTHALVCTCGEEELEIGEHTFEDGFCTVCEYEKPVNSFLPFIVTGVTQVKVIDAETEAALEGATFELYRISSTGSRKLHGTYTSNAIGRITARTLSPRFTYELVMTAAPEGYDLLEAPVIFRVQYNRPLQQVVPVTKTVVEEAPVETPAA